MVVGPVKGCKSSLVSVGPNLVVGPDVICMAHFDPTLPTYRTLTVYYVNLETKDPTLYHYSSRRRVRVNNGTYKNRCFD